MAELSQLQIGDKVIIRGKIIDINNEFKYPVIVELTKGSLTSYFSASELELDIIKEKKRVKKNG